MLNELTLLVASAGLGLSHLIMASHLISWQRGYRWTASDRESEVPPLRGLANRINQACTNFLETFPIFAAVALVAHATSHHSVATVLGAHLYFWGRIGYVIAAGVGWSLFRSVLFWNASVTGIVLIIAALFLT